MKTELRMTCPNCGERVASLLSHQNATRTAFVCRFAFPNRDEQSELSRREAAEQRGMMRQGALAWKAHNAAGEMSAAAVALGQALLHRRLAKIWSE